MSSVQVVFLPDVHVPYQDNVAWGRALQFIKEHQPATVVIMGDFLDCYHISRYDKYPGHASLGEEANIGIEMLKSLCATNATTIYYLEGNHEQRLSKYLVRHAAQLYGIMPTIPSLLHLSDLDIYWIPWGQTFYVDGIWVEHGDCSMSKSGYTAHQMLAKRGVFRGVSAHTHRLALVHYTSAGTVTKQWAEAGCLCNPSAMKEYVLFPDWQQGFIWSDETKQLHTELLC